MKTMPPHVASIGPKTTQAFETHTTKALPNGILQSCTTMMAEIRQRSGTGFWVLSEALETPAAPSKDAPESLEAALKPYLQRKALGYLILPLEEFLQVRSDKANDSLSTHHFVLVHLPPEGDTTMYAFTTPNHQWHKVAHALKSHQLALAPCSSPVFDEHACGQWAVYYTKLKRLLDDTSQAHLQNHAWYGVSPQASPSLPTEQRLKSLQTWQSALHKLSDALLERQALFFTEKKERTQSLKALFKTLNVLKNVKAIPGADIELAREVRLALLENPSRFRQFLKSHSALQQQFQSLRAFFPEPLLENDQALYQLKAALQTLSLYHAEGSISLQALTTATRHLKAALKNQQTLKKASQQLPHGTPAVIASALTGPHSKQKALRRWFDLAEQLPTPLWPHRHPHLDDPLMDTLLPRLQEKLRPLHKAHNVLGKYFDLLDLPSVRELEALQRHLPSSVVPSLGHKKKRQAVGALCDIALPKYQRRKRRLIQQLPALIHYAEALSDLDHFAKRHVQLRPFYRGVQTPVERLIQLRAWYRQVRKTYPKPSNGESDLGTALFDIPSVTARAVTQLAQTTWMPILESNHRHARWLSERQLSLTLETPKLSNTWQAMRQALSTLKNAGLDPQHCLNTLKAQCIALEQWQDSKQAWKQSPLGTRLLPQALPLSATKDLENPSLLGACRHHLKVALTALKDPQAYHALRQCQGHTSTLIAHYNALSQHYRAQHAAAQCFFVQNGTELSTWVNANTDESGDIDRLITRNQRALERPEQLSTWLDYQAAKSTLAQRGLSNTMALFEQHVTRVDILPTPDMPPNVSRLEPTQP